MRRTIKASKQNLVIFYTALIAFSIKGEHLPYLPSMNASQQITDFLTYRNYIKLSNTFTMLYLSPDYTVNTPISLYSIHGQSLQTPVSLCRKCRQLLYSSNYLKIPVKSKSFAI